MVPLPTISEVGSDRQLLVLLASVNEAIAVTEDQGLPPRDPRRMTRIRNDVLRGILLDALRYRGYAISPDGQQVSRVGSGAHIVTD